HALRLGVAGGDDVFQGARKPRIEQVAHRDIDRHWNRDARPMPGDRLLGGQLDQAGGEWLDQAHPLRHRDELARRDPAALRVTPASQGFEPGHLTRGNRDLWLVTEDDLAPGDGM